MVESTKQHIRTYCLASSEVKKDIIHSWTFVWRKVVQFIVDHSLEEKMRHFIVQQSVEEKNIKFIVGSKIWNKGLVTVD